jgi:hypothetical protein
VGTGLAQHAAVSLRGFLCLAIVLVGLPADGAVDLEDPRVPTHDTAHDEASPTPETFAVLPAPTVPTMPDPARSTAVYVEWGLGAPLGISGIEGVHRLGTWFELSAGLGEGLAASSNHRQPLQWAMMPRLRLGDDHTAFTIGAGLSAGEYGEVPLCIEEDCNNNTAPTRYVFWANTEMGGEHWFSRGLALRYFAGYARGCTTASCTATAYGAPLAIPYAGIGIGYAFGRR